VCFPLCGHIEYVLLLTYCLLHSCARSYTYCPRLICNTSSSPLFSYDCLFRPEFLVHSPSLVLNVIFLSLFFYTPVYTHVPATVFFLCLFYFSFFLAPCSPFGWPPFFAGRVSESFDASSAAVPPIRSPSIVFLSVVHACYFPLVSPFLTTHTVPGFRASHHRF